MIACTRCGRWHEDAETAEGKRLSCTEVKQYWTTLRNDHNNQYGHFPRISSDDNGVWFCMKCGRKF